MQPYTFCTENVLPLAWVGRLRGRLGVRACTLLVPMPAPVLMLIRAVPEGACIGSITRGRPVTLQLRACKICPWDLCLSPVKNWSLMLCLISINWACSVRGLSANSPCVVCLWLRLIFLLCLRAI